MMMYDNSLFNYNNNFNNFNNFNFSYDQDYEREQRIVTFLDKIKYPSIQENGQKKVGPPPDWQGDPPPKGCEVFVGHLPRDIREDVIFPIFARIGKIYELRLMMDFSGSNRGYGFIMYTNPQDAERAVRELNNFQIGPGKKIGVVMSKDNCRLFVGKIPRNVTRQEIFVELSRHTEQVVDVIVHQDHEHPHLNRGYAFIEYASHKAAAMARRHLLPAKIKLFGVEIQVDWADPESEVDHATMARVTNLYVRNIHANVGEEELKMLFSSLDPHLVVVRVKKVKDFAFIHFNSRPEAERALSLVTSSPAFGFQFSANGQGLEVKWAKPPEAVKKDGRRKGFNNQNRYQQQSPEQQQYQRPFTYQNDRTHVGRFNEMQPRSFQSTSYPAQGFQTKPLLPNFQAGGDIRHLSSPMIPSPVPFLCRSPNLLLSTPPPTGFVVQQSGYPHFNSTVGRNNSKNPFQMGLNFDCFAN